MKLFFLCFAVCLSFVPGLAGAVSSTLFLSPSGGSFHTGDIFTVDVMVDTQGNAVNAVAAYLSYSSDLLEVVSVETAGSPMEIIVERNYGLGRVEVLGGSPTPGFAGAHRVATMEFRAISAGIASLEFLPDSAVMTDLENENIFVPGAPTLYEINDVALDVPEESIPSASTYVYMDPIETFSTHSLLASLIGSFDLVESFLSSLRGLIHLQIIW